MFGKPTGVVLLALFLIVAFTMDFYNGGLMVFGLLPIPTAIGGLSAILFELVTGGWLMFQSIIL